MKISVSIFRLALNWGFSALGISEQREQKLKQTVHAAQMPRFPLPISFTVFGWAIDKRVFTVSQRTDSQVSGSGLDEKKSFLFPHCFRAMVAEHRPTHAFYVHSPRARRQPPSVLVRTIIGLLLPQRRYSSSARDGRLYGVPA